MASDTPYIAVRWSYVKKHDLLPLPLPLISRSELAVRQSKTLSLQSILKKTDSDDDACTGRHNPGIKGNLPFMTSSHNHSDRLLQTDAAATRKAPSPMFAREVRV